MLNVKKGTEAPFSLFFVNQMQEAVAAYFLVVEACADILVKIDAFACGFTVDFSVPSWVVVDEVNRLDIHQDIAPTVEDDELQGDDIFGVEVEGFVVVVCVRTENVWRNDLRAGVFTAAVFDKCVWIVIERKRVCTTCWVDTRTVVDIGKRVVVGAERICTTTYIDGNGN